MNEFVRLRERYLRDPLPVQLGGLAANLARVRSFADHPNHRDVVKRLVRESKFFIEWTAPKAPTDSQSALVELQRQLAQWERAWDAIWIEPLRKTAMVEQARLWSERVLAMASLIAQTIPQHPGNSG